jgi:glutamate synthase (NADPH/NADH) large chain
MSGGMAFVYDVENALPSYVNPDSVVWQRLDSAFWETQLKTLILEHVTETQSRFAQQLINDWALERGNFWQIAPKEMLSRLPQPLSDQPAEIRA